MKFMAKPLIVDAHEMIPLSTSPLYFMIPGVTYCACDDQPHGYITDEDGDTVRVNAGEFVVTYKDGKQACWPKSYFARLFDSVEK